MCIAIIIIKTDFEIVQLPVVDPQGSYSHGYIGATGNINSTYQQQGCMSQIT
jgi:hypothetical protein